MQYANIDCARTPSFRILATPIHATHRLFTCSDQIKYSYSAIFLRCSIESFVVWEFTNAHITGYSHKHTDKLQYSTHYQYYRKKYTYS
uniref:Uncharacterized protein n=1 Tax=Anguilla anguilla TaxID=7936 RepID=A0A0E9QW89_ANGAN